MKRAGNLMDKISDVDNLLSAYYKASRGKGLRREVMEYGSNLSANTQELRARLLANDVRIGNYRYFKIYDPKERLICAAAFEERVLHHAIMNVCHPYFERTLIYDTYATRPGKGIYAALGKARCAMGKYLWVAKLDFRKYFDSISHTVLKEKLRRLFKDKQLLALLERIIDSYQVSSGYGLPIGNLTSQYFANYYLSSIDHYAKEVLLIPVYLRYMDDILLFDTDKHKIKENVARIGDFSIQSCGSGVALKQSVIARTALGIAFLGYKLYPHKILLEKRSRRRLREKAIRYQMMLDEGIWDEQDYYEHITPLLSFAMYAYTKRTRMSIFYDE